MTKEDLTFFKNLLVEKKSQANADLHDLERQSRIDDTKESSDDHSSYSLHMADRGTDAMEREKTMLFAQREGAYLDYLDEALMRVEAGTYGSCRVCNEEIGRPRLEAVPTATQCIDCKSKIDKEASSE